MSKHKYIYILVCLIFLGGCKIKQNLPYNKPVAIPQKFSAKTDSTTTQLAGLQDFFADPALLALIDTALKNNFDLQVALQNIELARAGVRFTQGIDMPDLSANLTVGSRKFGNYTVDGVGNYDTQFSTNLDNKQQLPLPHIPDFFVGLQSSWEVDLWGKLKSKKKAAAARFIASEHGRNLIITSLVSEIADAYFQLLVLDNEQKILDDNIQLQQRALEIVKALKQAGEGNQLGVELMSAQLLSSQSLKVEVKQKIIENENKINFLSGRFPQPIERRTVAWENIVLPKLSAGVPSALLENRPDIKQAEFELIAADADIYAAKAAFYPSLNLNGSIGLQAFRAAVLFNPGSFAYNVAGGLFAPLLNRRQLIADLMAEEAEQRIAYINYRRTIVNSFTEVYNYLNLIENTNEIQELKSKEVDVLKGSITTSIELFKFGSATYLEVVTAQKNALQAQMELINLRKSQYNAVIGLYRALGGGWRSAI
ncbi:efflux transporter outer membrane subunit [Emticicia sp. BO119]|uniref:efflux transporter outer membrane subunit n=1 Tax=Emticicia sp. BO119 TaxID=2757768 RepID=UPI0015F0D4A2|nr:efflux transporter outer membrane subunit [Emticicia sp. BO119]MBA4850769.1 efflux transporter outer membrane subunit [Emticicia sp. BO119]